MRRKFELDHSNRFQPKLSFFSTLKDQTKKYELEKWIRENLFPLLKSFSCQQNINIINKSVQQLIYNNTHSLNDLMFLHQISLNYFKIMKMFIKNLELGKEKLSICEKYLGNTSYQDRNMIHISINELDSPSDINSFPLKKISKLNRSLNFRTIDEIM